MTAVADSSAFDVNVKTCSATCATRNFPHWKHAPNAIEIDHRPSLAEMEALQPNQFYYWQDVAFIQAHSIKNDRVMLICPICSVFLKKNGETRRYPITKPHSHGGFKAGTDQRVSVGSFEGREPHCLGTVYDRINKLRSKTKAFPCHLYGEHENHHLMPRMYVYVITSKTVFCDTKRKQQRNDIEEESST
jgi:hypothetical protein